MSKSDDDAVRDLVGVGILVALGAGAIYLVARAVAGYSAGDRITRQEAQQLSAPKDDEKTCHACEATEGLEYCHWCPNYYCSEHHDGVFCSSSCDYDYSDYWNQC